jgi:hypothetical protein
MRTVKQRAKTPNRLAIEAIQARDRTEVQEYKEANPCVDCGLYFHYSQMQFDHRPGEDKKREVSRLTGRRTIWAEIAKCDLVCANCHALRTWKRQHGLLLGVS